MIKTGKLGIERRTGQDMLDLRLSCFDRDDGRCVECGRRVYPELPPIADQSYHMAHIGGKRNHGDTLDNVRTLCGRDHRLEHAGGKPCPKK